MSDLIARVKPSEVYGDTGTVPVEIPSEGQFMACASRVDVCGYACCKFGSIGNWIYSLPGEVEEAQRQGLSFDHLNVTEQDEGGHAIECTRPCTGGEYKSIDCAIYPVFPANADATQFIVADTRKCPIPHNEMFQMVRTAQQVLWDWETKHPGSIAAAAKAGKDFSAYQPLKWEVSKEGIIRELSDEELEQIAPNVMKGDDFTPNYSSVDNSKYDGRHTPEDGRVISGSHIDMYIPGKLTPAPQEG